MTVKFGFGLVGFIALRVLAFALLILGILVLLVGLNESGMENYTWGGIAFLVSAFAVRRISNHVFMATAERTGENDDE